MTEDLHTQQLNPAQQQVLDQLGNTERPRFRGDLREDLRNSLEEAFGELIAAYQPPDQRANTKRILSITKRSLGLLHGCEARYIADENDEFTWSLPIARGSVAHKAIELFITHRGNPTPLELVEGALARIENDQRDLSAYVQQLTEAERADLAGQANDFVTTFTETFPPLKREWRPVAESRVMALFCDDQIELRGRVDLSIGRARGNYAGKVLIDLKTGRPNNGHVEDLRLYALLETLKLGVPPRLIVSYYMDAGTPRQEEVTEDLLWSASQRLVDGVAKMVALTGPEQRPPNKTAGPNCRWCPIQADCDEGQAFLSNENEDLPD